MPMPEICVRRYAETRRYEVADAHTGKASRSIPGAAHRSDILLCNSCAQIAKGVIYRTMWNPFTFAPTKPL